MAHIPKPQADALATAAFDTGKDAVLVLIGAHDWTPAQRARVVMWLRKEALDLEAKGGTYEHTMIASWDFGPV